MTSPSSTSKIWIPYALGAATVAATVAAAFLLVAASSRSDKFYVSLAAIVVAECLLFLSPILLHRREASAALPWHFAQSVLVWGYLLAVAVLAYVATTDIEIRQLSVLHIAALLGLLLGIGATRMAAGRTNDSHVALVEQEAQFRNSRDRFARVVDHIQLLPSTDFAAVKASFRKMQDDMRYMSAETLPGAEDAEMEVRSCIEGIDALAADLESQFQARNTDATATIGIQLEQGIERLRLALRRRNECIQALR